MSYITGTLPSNMVLCLHITSLYQLNVAFITLSLLLFLHVGNVLIKQNIPSENCPYL